ncbi:poly-beta-1,6 N-acetyl-D-glucosamine export porin PgaA [Glaesserella sp.]|uniref:poly-beta-1,6 N-acetyl-D-glucosamine export porin PgaA n=1 Tax=Glaesserella sp. TaxID=2094731 RepID=UPI0035A024B5
MKNFKFNLFSVLLAITYYPQGAVASTTDQLREGIIHYSRMNDEQLRIGTEKLAELYRNTLDHKVRDDLITLLVRQGRNTEALELCKECQVTDYSANELEHLAKAARNEGQRGASLAFYTQLTEVQPDNPNGLLGTSLITTEMAKFEVAKKYLAKYKSQFGEDEQYNEVYAYFLESSEPLTTRLDRLNRELEKNPSDTELAKKIYRLAAQLNMSTLQTNLIATYPDLFNEHDRLWFLHDEAIRLYRVASTREQMETAYKMLDEVNNQLSETENDELKVQVLRDMVVISSKLHNDSDVEKAYAQLQQLNPDMPLFVKEAYADYLLHSGSPFKALSMYKQIEEHYVQQKQEVPFELGIKIVNTLSDMAKFDQAKQYLVNHVSEPPAYISDFTHSRKVKNSNFDAYFLSKVNLLAWRGKLSEAHQLIDERLAQTPGDAWIMLRKAELENSRMRGDDALTWVDRAVATLGTNSRWAEVTRANIALSLNDWKTASSIINSLTAEEKHAAKYVVDQYEQAKSARFVASADVYHRTSPAGKPNENQQEYYLYSPKTKDGHEVYLHHLTSKSPDDNIDFKQSRLGVGAQLNFYPLTVKTEMGKGIKLNEKSYFSLDTSYRFNQHWRFNLNGNINGSNTPVKAIYQNVYTKDLGFSVNYTYSNAFNVSVAANGMKFDDGNLRKSLSLYSNFNVFKHDRWNLDSNVFWSLQRNKRTPSAYYYNPLKDQFAEGSFDLSYFQPFDHKMYLTHHLRSGIGRYWQDDYASQKTWSISYGHEWRLGKKVNISYELGRKKSVYDGSPEFNNFIKTDFSVYF